MYAAMKLNSDSCGCCRRLAKYARRLAAASVLVNRHRVRKVFFRIAFPQGRTRTQSAILALRGQGAAPPDGEGRSRQAESGQKPLVVQVFLGALPEPNTRENERRPAQSASPGKL